jgi:hypothetical protein
MQNDKLGLFDLMTFLVPGGTFLYILIFCIKPFVPLSDLFLVGDSNYLLIPYFFVSYFVGHLLSFWSRKLEYKGMGEKNAWMIYLNQNAARSAALNDLCSKHFEFSFIENEQIDVKKAENFFDTAYVLLETKQKSDKIALLMAQFAFFRTAAIVFGIGTIIFCISLATLKVYNMPIPLYNYFLLGSFFLSIFACIRLMRERKRWMMTAVYQNITAYFIKPLNDTKNESAKA